MSAREGVTMMHDITMLGTHSIENINFCEA